MGSVNRKLGGHRAHLSGESWQATVASAAYRTPRTPDAARVILHRVADGARRTGRGGARIVPVRQPYDFTGVIYYPRRPGLPPCPLACDAKSHDTATFAADSLPAHQVRALRELAEAGAAAGFLVHASRLGAALWIPADALPERGRMEWDAPGIRRLGAALEHWTWDWEVVLPAGYNWPPACAVTAP